MYSFEHSGLSVYELKPEFQMFRCPERNWEDEDMRDLQTERV